ncbi:MAG TPA: hypothetical protein GXX29_07905 [Firmicutes bacterium]|nr:hypothetical protein [Bacillota bacterium]
MEWNPAALGETRYQLQFSVTPATLKMTSDDFTVKDLVEIIRDILSEEERRSLLDKVNDGFLTTGLHLRGGAHGAIGSNGGGASVRLHVDGKFSSDAVRLLLLEDSEGEGKGEGEGRYSLKGTELESVLVGDYFISSVYSDPWLAKVLHITGFHMGGSLRFFRGLDYIKAVVPGSGVLQIVKDSAGGAKRIVSGGNIVTYQSQSGIGMAVDLGIYLRLTPNFAIDASIIDLGRMWWFEPKLVNYQLFIEPTDNTCRYMKKDEKPVDMRLTWDPPTTFRAGMTGAVGQKALWTLQYARPLGSSGAGKGEWVFGTQVKSFGIMPLRMAAKYSEATNDLKFSLGLGVELGPLTLDIGTSDLGGLMGFGNEGHVSVTTGLRFGW